MTVIIVRASLFSNVKLGEGLEMIQAKFLWIWFSYLKFLFW